MEFNQNYFLIYLFKFSYQVALNYLRVHSNFQDYHADQNGVVMPFPIIVKII